MEASGTGVPSSPSASTSITLWCWGDHVGIWPCPVQYLTGDCLVTPHANLQSAQSSTQLPYGRPSPIPLAGPKQVRTPALLAFLWHCHRACPAHCQLPTLGQRMQQPLPARLPA
ncbi:unnamed protein product [Pleuronectes platessa]|uniref:Uncharacterized protein n=1 Tax=Pleuronectes platessa TaxID=8262 RepID=A0A9N7YR41_PLEPL|nr:unnamed protein product [Pleuronectes platessa]